MRFSRNFAKAALNLSQYMVATQENINSKFCSVVEIKLSFFLKGGHLLVFSKCFRAGFWAFSTLKYKVNGIQICVTYGLWVEHLCDIYKWGCDPFCVSFLTDKLLKALR